MYFVAMLECCSIFILMHLVGHLLIIADRCHICFACHFQTVHPIPVIFISISTEITSPFQWHSWISRLRPGSIIPFQILHMHHISHPAYHTMFASYCLSIARGWLCSFCLLLFLGRAGIRVREQGACWVCLRGSRQLWELCRQDDHTLEITSIFAC